MCGICGCGAPVPDTGGAATDEDGPRSTTTAAMDAAHAHVHSHAHEHAHHGHDVSFLRVEQEILSLNSAHAARNRTWFTARETLAVNLMSSPGAGKTTLLVATIRRLDGRVPISVIEGDQQTDNDANRIRAGGAAAVQINTGRGCHLDAHAVGHAAQELDPAPGSIVVIENVGNLVCPAGFDLGEGVRVAILSTTEGSDKPVKYPDMFVAADLLLVNKIDLLPYVDFDVDAAVALARDVNPRIEVIQVSATRGEGLDEWIAWLVARSAHGVATHGYATPGRVR